MTSDHKTPVPGTTIPRIPTPNTDTPDTTTPGAAIPGAAAPDAAAADTPRSSTPRRHEAWQPRVQKDPPFNAFESDAARSPDARSPSGTIRDPKRDTAPLQGENDISDTDSLSNEYTPNQDNPTRGGDTPINDRGTQT